MKNHIGPIYLILGCMAVATLAIGAKPERHETQVRPAKAQDRIVVVLSPSTQIATAQPGRGTQGRQLKGADGGSYF